MITRIFWVVAVGALAYFLEYTGFPFEAMTRAVFYVLALILLLLLMMEDYFTKYTGRLPSSSERHTERKRGLFWSDPAFGLGVTLYAGLYVVVLRYSDTDGPYRLIEWLLQFTPTELFWLVAPIYLFWYFRKHVHAKPDAR